MVWKKVPPGDTGASDIFGGDDMNKVSDAFSGADVDDIDLNSDFSVRSGKRKLRNPANTFDYIETASAIAANRTVTEPLLTANDTRVYQAHSQTLTNKTMDATNNTFSNIPISSIRGGHRTKVYKIGSTYYAEKYNGALLASSGNFENVLQTALDQLGRVTIDQDGVFQFTSFGVNIPSFTTLQMNRNTVLRVPNTSANFTALTIGKTGYGTEVDFGTGSGPEKGFSQIIGGRIDRSSVQRDWIGVLMYSGNLEADGLPWCSLRDIHVFCPYTGFRFQTAVDGWMSDCDFRDLVAYAPAIGYEFVEAVGSTYGVIRCRFDHCSVQAHRAVPSPTIYGWYNVGRNDLTFDDCIVWDMNIATTPSQRRMVIKANANAIRIIGGVLAYPGGYFVDNSTSKDTVIVDEWNKQLPGATITDGKNIALGTATGTKIGTATTQKVGFFNATPVVQPTAIASPSLTTPTANETALKTAIDAIRTKLQALGLTA